MLIRPPISRCRFTTGCAGRRCLAVRRGDRHPNRRPRPVGSRQPRARIAVVGRPEAGVPGCRAARQPHATAGHAPARRQPDQISQARPGTLISGGAFCRAARQQPGAALAVKLAAPATVTVELVRVLVIGAGVHRRNRCSLRGGIAGLAVAPPTAGRGPHRAPDLCRGEGGAGRPPLPRERQAPELPATSGGELPGGLHLHLHGVTAEQVAAIVRQQEDDHERH